MKKLIIPDMGNSDPAEIIEILIAVGDQVEQEQSTIVLESEKATIEVPATASGRVEKLLVKVGDKIGSDQAYAEVSESDSAPKEETEQVEETAALTEETTEMPTADAEEEPENSSAPMSQSQIKQSLALHLRRKIHVKKINKQLRCMLGLPYVSWLES